MVLEPSARVGRAGQCVSEAGSHCMSKPACLSTNCNNAFPDHANKVVSIRSSSSTALADVK